MLKFRTPGAVLTVGCASLFFQVPASAQSSASCSTSITIGNAADATGVASCTTFTGDITVSPSATGTISLGGVQTLNGNLLVESSPDLSAFSAGDLESVDGYVYLTDLDSLDTLELPKLTSIGDQLRMVNLPALSQAQLESTLDNCPLVTISGTGLQTLDGLDPSGVTNGFNITSNENLTGNLTMSVKSTRATTQGKITVMYNAPGLSVSLPNLETAQNIDMANLSAVSLPQLTDCYELVLLGNAFQSFSAPKLTSVGNSTTFGILLNDNQGLVDVEFPELVRTGGLTVQNNSRLDTLTMDKLQMTNDAVVLEGAFSNVSFPDLQNVMKFQLQTTSDEFDCSPFERYKNQNVIKDLTCTTASKGNSTSPSPSSTGLSTGAKAGIGVGIAAAVIAVAAVAGFFFYRSRKRSQVKIASNVNNVEEPALEKSATPPAYESVAHLPNPLATGKRDGSQERSSRGPNELEAEPNQVYELQASSGYAELPSDNRHER
ncbi:protoplasts-secreted [Neofusicoccum ribis]|uniref:Protoplasts-secreted n=1 Tax=Neofusicoccum ribis TaxID=45134 RepID=A0ABR3SEE2_9PEZI